MIFNPVRFVRKLEEYALSVYDFPYADLEVDFQEEGHRVLVSLYWTGDDGHTNRKDIAWIPLDEFHIWVYTEGARRLVCHRVRALFDPTAEYQLGSVPKDFVRQAGKSKGRKRIEIAPYVLVKDGVEILINHHEYCEEHGLNKQSMLKVLRGELNSHKGYTRPISSHL